MKVILLWHVLLTDNTSNTSLRNNSWGLAGHLGQGVCRNDADRGGITLTAH